MIVNPIAALVAAVAAPQMMASSRAAPIGADRESDFRRFGIADTFQAVRKMPRSSLETPTG
jgi:hypothetical protein